MIFLEEEKKLKLLKESLEKGAVKKEEYKKQKKEIEAKIKRRETKKEEEIPEKKISEKILLVSIVFVILVFAVIFVARYFNQEEIRTIDDLHRLNLQGKLKPEEGYVYKGYSFVWANDLWYTQVQAGNTIISIPLHYGPRELEGIPMTGKFDTELFNSMPSYYVTFDPLGSDFSHVALAVGELNQNFVKTFGKMPVAACDKNETAACKARPVITCENTKERPVVYIKEEDETKIIFDGNCMIIQGRGLEIVRAVDKVLMMFYGIL